MKLDSGVADLHMHTTASDGTDTVGRRAEQAREMGLEAIAITDHDCVPSELGSRSEMIDGVEVITGVEVRAGIFDTKVEILGYYVDPNDDGLRSLLERVRSYREERNREMVERLSSVTGLELSYEDLEAETEGSLGRPHLARVLIENSVVDSVGEAFDDYLGRDSEAYVRMERAPSDEVIESIHDAGGVASLAHPGRIRSDRVPEMVDKLKSQGLDALEVWYPYGEIRDDDYADVDVEDAERLAGEADLLRTGGSDCHGESSDKYRIGSVRVPGSDLELLRESAKVY